MVSDAHTLLILKTIKEHGGENGIAWWADVGPALEPYGLDFDSVDALRAKGLIERSKEIGRLGLTAAGLSRIA